MITKQQADRCPTHHFACDCREYLFQEVVEQFNEALIAWEAKLSIWPNIKEAQRMHKARAVLAKLEVK